MQVATMAKPKRFCTILLRLLALGATVSATIVMATNHETSQVFNLSFDAKFSHTPAFKYFVVANAVGSLYGLLAVFLCPESSLWRLVVALDVVCTMLLTSSLSAALAIAEVGKKGNSHAGWLPICGQVPKFCDHAKGSLIAAFIGVVVYMILLLYYIHTGAV